MIMRPGGAVEARARPPSAGAGAARGRSRAAPTSVAQRRGPSSGAPARVGHLRAGRLRSRRRSRLHVGRNPGPQRTKGQSRSHPVSGAAAATTDDDDLLQRASATTRGGVTRLPRHGRPGEFAGHVDQSTSNPRLYHSLVTLAATAEPDPCGSVRELVAAGIRGTGVKDSFATSTSLRWDSAPLRRAVDRRAASAPGWRTRCRRSLAQGGARGNSPTGNRHGPVPVDRVAVTRAGVSTGAAHERQRRLHCRVWGHRLVAGAIANRAAKMSAGRTSLCPPCRPTAFGAVSGAGCAFRPPGRRL